MLATATGFWTGLFPYAGDTSNKVIGAVLAAYQVVPYDSEPQSADHLALRTAARRRRRTRPRGYVEWTILESLMLLRPAPVVHAVLYQALQAAQDSRARWHYDGHEAVVSLEDVLSQWESQGCMPPIVAPIGHGLAEKIANGFRCMHCVAIHGKLEVRQLFLSNEPPRKARRIAPVVERVASNSSRAWQTPAWPRRKKPSLVVDYLDASFEIKISAE